MQITEDDVRQLALENWVLRRDLARAEAAIEELRRAPAESQANIRTCSETHPGEDMYHPGGHLATEG